MKYILTNIDYDLSELSLGNELEVMAQLPRELTFDLDDPDCKVAKLNAMIESVTGYRVVNWVCQWR